MVAGLSPRTVAWGYGIRVLCGDAFFSRWCGGRGEGMVLGNYRRHMLRSLGSHVIIALRLKNHLPVMYVFLYHDRKQ